MRASTANPARLSPLRRHAPVLLLRRPADLPYLVVLTGGSALFRTSERSAVATENLGPSGAAVLAAVTAATVAATTVAGTSLLPSAVLGGPGSGPAFTSTTTCDKGATAAALALALRAMDANPPANPLEPRRHEAWRKILHFRPTPMAVFEMLVWGTFGNSARSSSYIAMPRIWRTALVRVVRDVGLLTRMLSRLVPSRWSLLSSPDSFGGPEICSPGPYAARVHPPCATRKLGFFFFGHKKRLCAWLTGTQIYSVSEQMIVLSLRFACDLPVLAVPLVLVAQL
jgi:hypothetical protein